jgi:putative oxidoreductase
MSSSSTRAHGSLGSNIALVLLRAALGADFVAHGSQKLFGAFNGGIGVTATFFDSLGAHPGTLWAVVAGVVEFGGGIAMLLGMFVRLAGVALAVDMLLAIALDTAKEGFFAGWELNVLIIAMALAMVLLGAGRYALATVVRGSGDNALRRRIAML